MTLVDTKTLTQQLDVSRTTLHVLEKRGVVRPLRIGRAVRWNPEQVLRDLQRTNTADSHGSNNLQAA